MDLNFKCGFWHPFGPHAGEDPDPILDRKRSEIKRIPNGWTLWSFRHRKSLDLWRSMLPKSRPVYVLCSDSPKAQDPQTPPLYARFFRSGSHKVFRPIPRGVSVPHPSTAAGLGSAFVVDKVINFDADETRPHFGVRWFCVETSKWRTDNLPTRGEYLVRTPGPVRTRSIYAVLRLRPPYIVEISTSAG